MKKKYKMWSFLIVALVVILHQPNISHAMKKHELIEEMKSSSSVYSSRRNNNNNLSSSLSTPSILIERNDFEEGSKIPPQFLCPVTYEVMEEPCSNELGHTYEKSVLEKLLREGKPDPLTQKPFQHMFPAFSLKQLIQDWKEQNTIVVKPGFPYMKERKDPTAQAYWNLAKDLEEKGDFEEAERNYKEALKYTDNPETYKKYAQLLAKVGYTEKAHRAFYELGYLYQTNDSLQDAQISYKEALRLCPTSSREGTLRALITIHKKLHNLKEVGDTLKELGHLYMSKYQMNEGIKVLEEAYELYPEMNVLEELCSLYTQTQNEVKIVQTQERIFQFTLMNEPENIGIYRNYSKFLKSIGKPQEAALQKQKYDATLQNLITEVKDLRLQLETLTSLLPKRAEETPKVERIEIIERPIRVAIPEVARGHEEIYERFLRGVLIYRPQEGSDVGKIEMPIANLANPLEGTFDLSSCGDTGQYLSIATGYRKGVKAENANKVEIWFTPRFLVDKEMSQLAQNHHMRAISGNWDAARAPIGIFWTWGGWNASGQLAYCDYLTTESMDNLGSENLLKKYEKRGGAGRCAVCAGVWSSDQISHFVCELK